MACVTAFVGELLARCQCFGFFRILGLFILSAVYMIAERTSDAVLEDARKIIAVDFCATAPAITSPSWSFFRAGGVRSASVEPLLSDFGRPADNGQVRC
jgi:hypothetical protein